MTEILIHIGFPKTGSSYLQHHVFPNATDREYLGKHHVGESFPSAFDRIEKAILGMSNAEFADNEHELAKLISGYLVSNGRQRFVLSHEGFSRPARYGNLNGWLPLCEIATRFRRLFSGSGENPVHVRFLIVLRSQFTLLPTYFAQVSEEESALGLYRNDFDDFVDFATASDRQGSEMFDFRSVVRAFDCQFGRENVSVLLYESLFSGEARARDTLKSCLGLTDKRLQDLMARTPVNKSSSRQLASSGLLSAKRIRKSRRFNWLPASLRLWLAERLSPASTDDVPTLSETNRLKIVRAFSGSNNTLAKDRTLEMERYDYPLSES